MARLSPYKRGNDAYDPAGDFCEQFTRDPFLAAFLGGSVIDVTHDGANVTVDVAHGLKRAYQGAFLMGADGTEPVAAMLPEDAESAGVNISTHARFVQATATAMTSRFRIF